MNVRTRRRQHPSTTTRLSQYAAVSHYNAEYKAVLAATGMTRKEWRALPSTARKELRTAHGKFDPILARIRAENSAVLHGVNAPPVATREGFIYVVTNPAWPGHVKIGRALDPEDRRGQFNTSDPHRAFKLEGYIYTTRRHVAEKAIHEALAQHRVQGTEWFTCSVGLALNVVRDLCAYVEQPY